MAAGSRTSAYRTLDLAAWCNAGPELLGDAPHPRWRAESFQGLPFRIANGPRAFVGLGEGLRREAVTLRVGAAAQWLIVAHRLLDGDASAPDVGRLVATYVLTLADGQQHRVPIRERFEITGLSDFGHLAFLALPDEANRLQDRWRGPWEQAGYRQTEVSQGWPRNYVLWRWRNPTPEVQVESLEIVPAGPRFLVAAVTLGVTDEDPFLRDAPVPVRIELKDAALAEKGLAPDAADLRVRVDRGLASYVYPLPSGEAESFAGWGEGQSLHVSPAYAEVAALPSATVSIEAGDETVAEVAWGDVLQQRAVETERARLAIVEDGRNWVETVILDDATGQPVACRVHFRSPHGVPYQPHGHHNHVNSNNATWHVDVGGDLRLGQITYAYVNGRCQGWLPRGDLLVDVARGYEYEPLRTRVSIAPGQRRLELRLRRWTDMNAKRWFSGDTHVHFLSTQGSLREAQAEDLNVVNLLQSQWGSLFTNTEDFTGQPVTSNDGRTIVWANQENRQHMLGHLILLGLKEPVYPWCSDGPSEAALGSTMETTLSAWADACHAQGGTVVIPHFPVPNAEPATLVATGRADAVEMIIHQNYFHGEYYRYLNAGYRLPLVGGTDKMSSDVAVGQYRTYVYVPEDEEFSYAAWCRNLRAGRTFMSGGPLLELSVDGAAIGDMVHVAASGGTVEVRAVAESILPVHALQLVHNGRVVAESNAPGGTRKLVLNERVRVDANGWLCARVGGPDYRPLAHHDTWRRGIFAHTSPVYVVCGEGNWSMADRDGLQYMRTLVGGSLEYIRHMPARFPDEHVTHHHGESDHLAFLERPFREALAALEARLAEHRP
jgi:hypothetical protein